MEKEIISCINNKEKELDLFCKAMGKKSNTHITVILPNGRVIADSDNTPSQMDDHATREEVKKALAGKIGNTIRYSDTLHESMLYVAIPILMNEKLVVVIRTSLPVTQLNQTEKK